MSEVSKDYGNYIKERRISKRMSQAEVAKKLGISQVAYGRYELGIREPNFDLMMQISVILDFKLSEFFDNYMAQRFGWYAERLKERKDDSDNR